MIIIGEESVQEESQNDGRKMVFYRFSKFLLEHDQKNELGVVISEVIQGKSTEKQMNKSSLHQDETEEKVIPGAKEDDGEEVGISR